MLKYANKCELSTTMVASLWEEEHDLDLAARLADPPDTPAARCGMA